jgi:hypothetical protein
MWTRDQVILWISLTLVSILGGLVSYYRKIADGSTTHALWRLAGELLTSAFAGLSVGMLLAESSTSMAWTFALVGIVGHMGSRALDVLEDVVKQVLWTMGRVERRDSERRDDGRRRDDRNADQ